MIEVFPNVFVGDQSAYEEHAKHHDDWFIIQACKEPYHRLAVGYQGRSAGKDNPENIVARRDNKLICNLIDINNPEFIPHQVITESLKFFQEARTQNKTILLHCNFGRSRAPGITMLALAKHTDCFKNPNNFQQTKMEMQKLYPNLNMSKGISLYLEKYWLLHLHNQL